MSGEGEICGGCCAIFCSSTLTNWCDQKAFGRGNGRGCCGGSRGCCHSCFSEGFDEDAWDKKNKADRQKKRASAGQTQTEQPAATPQMVAPSTPEAATTK